MLDSYILHMIDLCTGVHKEIKINVMVFNTEKLQSPEKISAEGTYNMYVHSWFHDDRKWQLLL